MVSFMRYAVPTCGLCNDRHNTPRSGAKMKTITKTTVATSTMVGPEAMFQ